MSKKYYVQPDLFEHSPTSAETQVPADLKRDTAIEVQRAKKIPNPNARRIFRDDVALPPVALREPERPYLSDVSVAARYAVSRPTIWRWVKAGAGFPSPVKYASGTTRRRLVDLQAYDLGRLQHQSYPSPLTGKGRAQ